MKYKITEVEQKKKPKSFLRVVCRRRYTLNVAEGNRSERDGFVPVPQEPQDIRNNDDSAVLTFHPTGFAPPLLLQAPPPLTLR